MKSCLRIPRLFLSRIEPERWLTGIRLADPDELNGRSFLLPKELFGKEEAKEQIERIRNDMYRALEEGLLGRLDRGCVLVERTQGKLTRYGILACIDLEEYSPEGSKQAAIRASMECDPDTVRGILALREGALLEFPHTVLCYRDKRDKLLRALLEEELEELYDISLAGGGKLKGSFLPDFVSEELVHDLISHADPCFGVLDGHNYLAAAKANWERIAEQISPREARNHPARFTLAEFVNLSDDAVLLDGIKKEELLSSLKAGKLLPRGAFTLGGAGNRFGLEGREISYD